MLNTETFKDEWEGSKERHETTRRRLAMLSHDWKDLVISIIDEAPYLSDQTKKSLKGFVYTTENIFEFAIQQLSPIYNEAPKRSLVPEGEEELSEEMAQLFEDVYNTVFTNMALGEASPLTMGCGVTGLRPRWSARTNRMVVEVITGDRLASRPDSTDPLVSEFTIIQQPDKSGWTVYTEKQMFQYDKDWKLLIDGKPIEHELKDVSEDDPRFRNPYGVIPVVIAHSRYPAKDFWHTSDSEGLEQLNLATAISRAMYRRTEAYQSFLQLAVIGPPDDGEGEFSKKVRLSVDSIIPLPYASSIQILDLQADLTSRFEVILQQIDVGLSLYGLNPDSYRKKGTESSGFALQLKREDQENVWKKQRTIWEVTEQLLYDVAREVVGVESGGEDSNSPTFVLPKGTVQLEWSPLGLTSSPQEKWDLSKSKIDGGVMSRLEYLMEERGISKEEAEKLLAEIDLEDSASTNREIPVPPNPNDPPTGDPQPEPNPEPDTGGGE